MKLAKCTLPNLQLQAWNKSIQNIFLMNHKSNCHSMAYPYEKASIHSTGTFEIIKKSEG